jgi:DNA-binding beta-propeller fold protein YncE
MGFHRGELMRQITFLCILLASAAALAGDAEPLVIEKNIPLPKVEGRIDHLAIDLKTNRLFIAALGNNTVEVVDLNKGERVQTISGLEEPQGICFLPESKKLIVACGGDGSCRVYNGDTLSLEKKIDLKSDADNVRYDPASSTIYVGHGDGAIAAIDAKTFEVSKDIKLSGHPEAFAIDKSSNRIYVNVPTSKQVEVIDLTKNEVVEKWKLKEARSNFPMALDEKGSRLLIGCREPARMVVLDTKTGTVAQSLEIVGDVDDIFIDTEKARIYITGGEGAVDVFAVANDGEIRKEASIATSKGARTGLYVAAQRCLYVARRKGAEDAQISILTVK